MLITILLVTLATYRLATDFTQEHGPFGLYRRLRHALKGFAETRLNNSSVNDPAEHWLYWLYDGADCFHCASFWLSLALTFVAAYWQPLINWQDLLLTWLASAGLASALQRTITALAAAPTVSTKEEFQTWLNEHLSAPPAVQSILSSTEEVLPPPSNFADS